MQKRLNLVAPALLALIATTLSCSTTDPAPAATSTTFNESNAWTHLESIVAFGPRPAGSPANDNLRDYIEAQLQILGLEVQREPFTDSTPIGDVNFENIFVDIPPNAPGADPAGLSLIIGTHFDTKIVENEDGSPNRFVGANDGGSGTAILLELARVMTQEEFQRTAPLRLLFIDGEEAFNFDWDGKDNTYGSRHHANKLRETKQVASIGAVVILDMLGDKDLTIFHDTYSRRELMELFEQAAATHGLGQYMATHFRMPIKDDHISFLNVGIPAVDLIDFEYGAQNLIWHTNNDTLENCSSRSLRNAGNIFLSGYPELESWIQKQ
ncbi:MAG: hypothetical protein ACJAZ8_002644 [Planctomycetota bacterium]|jgi:hypothetical protein